MRRKKRFGISVLYIALRAGTYLIPLIFHGIGTSKIRQSLKAVK
jgi:hypothetical protein